MASLLLVRDEQPAVRPEPVEGAGGMRWFVCHPLLMPQGRHFSCFAMKSNQKKATPTFAPGLRPRPSPGQALIRDLKRRRRAVRNSLRPNNGPLHRRFYSKSRARIHGDPVEPMFDRFAMSTTGTRMRASGLRLLLCNCSTAIYVSISLYLKSTSSASIRATSLRYANFLFGSSTNSCATFLFKAFSTFSQFLSSPNSPTHRIL